METDLPTLVDLDFDIPSEAALFFKNYKGWEPKDVWAEIVTFESNSIDMSKLDNLIFQKSKDFFTLEKRNGNSPKCYGLNFTEENAKLNWINRRLGDLNINLPQAFDALEQFKDGHLLECFKCLSKEAIDYETKALHFSAHMFFEKPEIKKELHSLVQNFAYKKFMESKKTAKLHTVLSRKGNDNLIIEEETSESGLGFVDKFVSIATLRNKLESVLSDIKSRKWSSAYPHVWGNKLYNRAVNDKSQGF